MTPCVPMTPCALIGLVQHPSIIHRSPSLICICGQPHAMAPPLLGFGNNDTGSCSILLPLPLIQYIDIRCVIYFIIVIMHVC